MAVHHLRTPISDDDVRKLSVGDIVYVSGLVVTARDAAHRRVVEQGTPPPIDMKGLVLYHAGPCVKRTESGWLVLSVGPTTSARMDRYERDFVARTGVKLIVGKGSMGRTTAEAARELCFAVTLFVGGCGALAASKIRRVVDVHWLDLGVPEALWVLEVENFGPLIVTIDASGRSLWSEIMENLSRASREVLNDLKKGLSVVLGWSRR